MVETRANGFHRDKNLVVGDRHKFLVGIYLNIYHSLHFSKGFLYRTSAATTLDVGGRKRGFCHALVYRWFCGLYNGHGAVYNGGRIPRKEN